jgi:hypothetical protein
MPKPNGVRTVELAGQRSVILPEAGSQKGVRNLFGEKKSLDSFSSPNASLEKAPRGYDNAGPEVCE